MSHDPVLLQKIWDAVSSIPRGKVAAYGEVARMAGLPGKARLVGQALKHLPRGSHVPWHRVINAGGRISFPQGSPAWERQYQRLLDEGVPFQGGRIASSARISADYLDALLWAPENLG
jgi:methylated-DNA-protein-cysteine methyltransferase-like protein